MREVEKAWGRELIIVNCDKYCGKLLCLNKGAESSYHQHFKKQETFFCLEGQVALNIENRNYILKPYSMPKTVFPASLHKFRGITSALIIEFSMPHDDKDVYRVSESKARVSE